ncbi:hypothetical protein LWI28_020204 [Acer negundo]|uniref:Uncharacterized protein n=1 Tax=Acer negundo TaxID=4023 RepID=A0AAD5NGV1_ACENE|nr:hypothetical protein LWI28_020204 [Acer negundo]KAK4836532.1 hypothetical protein QYF36_024385 [Acer negundo]
MGLNFAPKSIQFTKVIVPPHTLAFSNKSISFVSTPLFKPLTCRNRLNHWRLKRACSGDFNGFCDEEFALKLDIDDDKYNKDTVYNNVLGIRSEPAEWAERSDEIVRLNIEHKANCLGIPLSLRIIKRKKKWKQGLGDFAYSSVNKAFSSLVFIIRELQSYLLLARENIYGEDLKEMINRVQGEMNASFVWLFQQVFSKTPTLMVYVMLLLANSTVHSMSNNAVIAATPSPSSPRLSYSSICISETVSHEMTQEEVHLWNLIVEEASMMEDGWILDHETMKQFVTSVTVELERDDYENYLKTDLLYQMGLAEEPNNPLLLSNYARFLHLVARDYDRAEELFNRAIQLQAADAEALSGYADFLWIIRKDLWGAEERYQQAMAADPNNPSHASRYASFLWITGAEDTCFPITTSHANGNKVL